MTIAIFDMDYTLTRRGTWGRFVWSTVRGRPWLWLPLIVETVRDQIQYKRGKRPRGAVKQSMMRWSLRHRSRSELRAMAQKFAEREIAKGFRPGAWEALAYHRERGDHILIASAAVDLIVNPIAEALNVDGVVCTKMSWSEERCEEEFASQNCYGEMKREAVTEYLQAHGLWGPTVFYTDSSADFSLVPIMNATIVVDPKPKTRREAERLGLPMQCWIQDQGGFVPPDCPTMRRIELILSPAKT